jgi:hypothetical protein
MLIPGPDMFLVTLVDDLVILDVIEDSYQVMQGAVVPPGAGRPLVGSAAEIDPEAAAALLSAGICSEGREDRRPLGMPVASETVSASASVRATAIDLLGFASALLLAAWRARRTRTCRSFSSTRSAARDSVQAAELQDALARLRSARILIPAPRRCLPASLTTAAYLGLKGIDCEIVFGVRGHPFAAHCWVERDGVVLDDELDRVRAFTPIAVGRP